MARATKRSDPAGVRRSICPVSCGLEIFGDRWTLLVIRDLFFGKTRFKELVASPESIPTNLLSDRLARLHRHGIVAQVVPPDGSKHLAYQLTEKGKALLPVIAAMRDWGLEWESDTEDKLSGS